MPSTVTWRSAVRFRSMSTNVGMIGKLAIVNDTLPLSHTWGGPPTGGRSHGIATSCERCGDTDVVVFVQSGSGLFFTTRPRNASRSKVAVIVPLLDVNASGRSGASSPGARCRCRTRPGSGWRTSTSCAMSAESLHARAGFVPTRDEEVGHAVVAHLQPGVEQRDRRGVADQRLGDGLHRGQRRGRRRHGGHHPDRDQRREQQSASPCDYPSGFPPVRSQARLRCASCLRLYR